LFIKTNFKMNTQEKLKTLKGKFIEEIAKEIFEDIEADLQEKEK